MVLLLEPGIEAASDRLLDLGGDAFIGQNAVVIVESVERGDRAIADPPARLPNVMLLPHIGSGTKETRAAMLDLAIDNLLAALRGERPKCLVNPEALDARQANG